MKGWFLGGAVVLVSLGVAGSAGAKPRHDGFTGDLGIGISLMLVPRHTACVSSTPDGCAGFEGDRTDKELGLAPLSLSLGGFVSPKVAILARAAGTSYFDRGDQIVHNFYGAIVEIWPSDYVYLSGGVGFALFGENPFLSGGNDYLEGGWALDVRAGVALAQGTNHDFTLSIEAIPGFYEDETVVGFGLVGAWKWY
ncbi:MAG TPA: hypothetical protein VEX18_22800 [Polyangiaceae bacterium]|nr:hypothetical protein [Polyangiaceae bacterium]